MATPFRFEGPKLVEFNREVLDHVIVGAASKVAGIRGVGYVREELQRAGISDTGALGKSIKSRVEFTPLGPLLHIYSDMSMTDNKPVAVWVNDGTGIYNEAQLGPAGSGRIFPTQSTVLRFNPAKRSSARGRRGVFNSAASGRFTSNYVYAPSVRGQHPTHFMQNALRRIKVTTFSV